MGQVHAARDIWLDPKYLLTRLAQCGWCNGGLFVHSRAHGSHRAFLYACTSYHLRGRAVCANRQLLPMNLTSAHVLNTFRVDLLNPKVIEGALSKLQSRLSAAPADSRVTAFEAERARLSLESDRLAAGLAAGGTLTSLLAAVRNA